jgi:TetR/AcrR family transcriptional regulator
MNKQFQDYLGQRKAEIISAALKLADEVGITGITTKRLAQEVGVVEGALYRHIKTKLDIFSMILDLSTHLIDQKFKEIQVRKLDPSAALRDFYVFAVDFLEDSPGIYLLLFSDALYVENTALLRQFRTFILNLKGRFEVLIRRGVRTRVFRSDVNPQTFAILYLGVIHTAFTLWNIVETRAKSFRKTALPLIEEFLNSMRAGPPKSRPA